MGRRVAIVLLVAGCGSGSNGGNPGGDPDAAEAGTPDAASPDAASPDAAVSEVPFEDRTWGELEPLGDGWWPSVAIDAAGDVMTVWENPSFVDGGCIARRRVLDSGWDADVVLVTPQAVRDELVEPGKTESSYEDYCAGREAVAVNAAGRATALFVHHRVLRDDETNGVENWNTGIRAMFEPAIGWGDAERSGPSGRDLFDFGVAMNAAGAGLIAWTVDDQAWATDYQPGTGWQGAAPVEMAGAGFLYGPHVRLKADGDGMATWSWSGAGSHLRVAWRVAGVWTEPAQVNDDNRVRAEWDVALNDAGEAVVIWRDCEGPGDVGCEIRARRFDPVGGWQASVRLGEAGDDDEDGRSDGVEVAVDPAGNAVAVWATYWPDPKGGAPLPRVNAALLRNGVWTYAGTIGLGAAGDERLGPRVVLDRDGNGLVGWGVKRLDEYEDYHGELMARTYMPDTGFGPVELLQATGYTSRLELAMNPAGVAVAVWSDGYAAKAKLFR